MDFNNVKKLFDFYNQINNLPNIPGYLKALKGYSQGVLARNIILGEKGGDLASFIKNGGAMAAADEENGSSGDSDVELQPYGTSPEDHEILTRVPRPVTAVAALVEVLKGVEEEGTLHKTVRLVADNKVFAEVSLVVNIDEEDNVKLSLPLKEKLGKGIAAQLQILDTLSNRYTAPKLSSWPKNDFAFKQSQDHGWFLEALHDIEKDVTFTFQAEWNGKAFIEPKLTGESTAVADEPEQKADEKETSEEKPEGQPASPETPAATETPAPSINKIQGKTIDEIASMDENTLKQFRAGLSDADRASFNKLYNLFRRLANPLAQATPEEATK